MPNSYEFDDNAGVKLSEALANEPLCRGHLVAGTQHVETDISWVQVVDHPDIASWVKDGHLLLSTGYNWPKEGPAASAIVEKLAAKGVCGVVLAVPHFLDHFPPPSIEAAERVGLPLIEIPWEVPFSEITQAVHRELVDQQGKALVRSEQIHRELTEAAVSGNSLSDVAQVLGRVLGRRIDLLSVDGHVLGTYLPEGLGGGETAAHAAAQAAYLAIQEAGDLKRVDVSAHPIRMHWPAGGEAGHASVVMYAARVREEGVGYVLVAEGPQALTALDLRAIEHAGTVAALQISHQRELSMQEARLGHALVAALIEGRFEERPNTLERARLLGWNPVLRYRLCTVLLDEPNPLSRSGFDKREAFAAQAGLSLQRRNIHPLLSLSANQIHILVPEELDVDAWWGEFPASRLAMAVSTSKTGVQGMHEAGIEASELIEHLLPGRVHRFDEMLFPRVLRGDSEAQGQFVARIFGQLIDGKRGQTLLDTALALSKEGFHLQHTAERLGVHISTLRYRMERLAEVSGLDLESAEGKFRLQVGARLYLMGEQ
jgi:PucR family transcriptional regulator, purine catabolism regulatory protein